MFVLLLLIPPWNQKRDSEIGLEINLRPFPAIKLTFIYVSLGYLGISFRLVSAFQRRISAASAATVIGRSIIRAIKVSIGGLAITLG